MPDKLEGVGGTVSFQKKLIKGLTEYGIDLNFDLSVTDFDILLIINATSKLDLVRRCKKRDIPIVQRLGGLNWIHRKKIDSISAFFLGEVRNILMKIIRSRFADYNVYQSNFVKSWWENECGKKEIESSIIYNGVDLNVFSPDGPKCVLNEGPYFISVEGTQGGHPTNISIDLAKSLNKIGEKINLLIFGNASSEIRSEFSKYPFVHFKGPVPNDELPFYYRGASFYIATDIIAACPNSVIEAMASGTPVLGYNAGVLDEMVLPDAGVTVEYPGNPWKLKPIDSIESLIAGAEKILSKFDHYSTGARTTAEKKFDNKRMLSEYIAVFEKTIMKQY